MVARNNLINTLCLTLFNDIQAMLHLIKGVFDYRNNQLTQSQFTLATEYACRWLDVTYVRVGNYFWKTARMAVITVVWFYIW